jgi:hypothetical protein
MSRSTYYGPFMRPEDRKRMIEHATLDLVMCAVAAIVVWKVIIPALPHYMIWLPPLAALLLAVVIGRLWPGAQRRRAPHW